MTAKSITITSCLAIFYIAAGLLLYSVVVALSGDTATLWGDFYAPLAGSCAVQAELLYGAWFVLCALMLSHLIYLAIRAMRRNTKPADSANVQQEAPTTLVQHAEPHPQKEAERTPVVTIDYQAVGQECKRIRTGFEQLRRRGGYTIGQEGSSDLGLCDASLAARHLELRIEKDDRLSLSHLLPGVKDSVRINGRYLKQGETQILDAYSDVYVGASKLKITVQ